MMMRRKKKGKKKQKEDAYIYSGSSRGVRAHARTFQQCNKSQHVSAPVIIYFFGGL